MNNRSHGNADYLLISGATSGIGLATAKRALDGGYHVIGCCYPDVASGKVLERYAPEHVGLLQVAHDAWVSWLVAKLPAFARDRLTDSIVRSYAVKAERARQVRGRSDNPVH